MIKEDILKNIQASSVRVEKSLARQEGKIVSTPAFKKMVHRNYQQCSIDCGYCKGIDLRYSLEQLNGKLA